MARNIIPTLVESAAAPSEKLLRRLPIATSAAAKQSKVSNADVLSNIFCHGRQKKRRFIGLVLYTQKNQFKRRIMSVYAATDKGLEHRRFFQKPLPSSERQTKTVWVGVVIRTKLSTLVV